jgi:glycosyltransferase involved in cell wall biosynthesis
MSATLFFVPISLVSFSYLITLAGMINLATVIMAGVMVLPNLTLKINVTAFVELFQPLFTRHNPVNHDILRILVFNWRDTQHVWGGGAEVYLHELAKRWVASGHQVTFFCGNDGHHSHKETIDGVQIIRYGGFYTVYAWAFIYYIFKLRGKFDVLIDSANGIPFFTPLFSRLPKFLVIHHVHQQVFRQHLKFPLLQLATFLEQKMMPLFYRKETIITVSKASKADLIKYMSFKDGQIEIVNPGIDLNTYYPRLPKTKHPSFVYIGRLQPYKNVDISIRAFSQILTHFPDAKFEIAGAGECESELKKLVKALNIADQVSFHGRISEAEKVLLLSQSWVMLQPSSFEGWGITVIEANACGTPVIASKIMGLRESVLNHKTGLSVKPKNVEALSIAMKKMINSTTSYRFYKINCMIWASQHHWDLKAMAFLSAIYKHTSVQIKEPIALEPAIISHEVTSI